MARSFYFGADETMVSGSAVFSAMINADPSALGLSDEQVAGYRDIDAALQDAYRAVTNPLTRSPVAVAHKNAMMKSMQRRASDLSSILHARASVTDAQLISLGLLPRRKRTRRNAPDAPPAVRVIAVAGRVATVRVCGRESQSGRSKPFGARGSDLYSYVGDAPPTDPRAYHYEGFTGRTTARITFPDDVANGATVWLSARWVTARAETSTASAPVHFTLQGGPARAAA